MVELYGVLGIDDHRLHVGKGEQGEQNRVGPYRQHAFTCHGEGELLTQRQKLSILTPLEEHPLVGRKYGRAKTGVLHVGEQLTCLPVMPLGDIGERVVPLQGSELVVRIQAGCHGAFCARYKVFFCLQGAEGSAPWTEVEDTLQPLCLGFSLERGAVLPLPRAKGKREVLHKVGIQLPFGHGGDGLLGEGGQYADYG